MAPNDVIVPNYTDVTNVKAKIHLLRPMKPADFGNREVIV